jgi:hypothetical protein
MTPRRLEFFKFVDPFPRRGPAEGESHPEYGHPTAYDGDFIANPSIGLVPLGDHNLPGERNNLFTAQANFRVTRRHLSLVEDVDGVDMVRPASPYRFDFGVATLFGEADVKDAIRDSLCGPPPVRPGELLGRVLRGAWRCWAVVELQNGLRDCVAGDSEHEVAALTGDRTDVKRVLESSQEIAAE